MAFPRARVRVCACVRAFVRACVRACVHCRRARSSKSNCADALVSSSRPSEAGHTELGPLTGRAHQTARPQCEYSQPADSQLSALNSHLSTLNSQLFLLSPLNSQLPTFDHANHASQSTTPAASLSGIQLIAYS